MWKQLSLFRGWTHLLLRESSTGLLSAFRMSIANNRAVGFTVVYRKYHTCLDDSNCDVKFKVEFKCALFTFSILILGVKSVVFSTICQTIPLLQGENTIHGAL